MMTAQLSSPKLAAQMTALSVKRPSISTLKRKLSADDETASPTSLDELSSSSSSADEASVISPKKKIKAEGSATISTAMTKWEEPQDVKVVGQAPSTPTASSAPATPSAAYVPFRFTSAPASALDEAELNILNYFLA
ncbi:hypothetical protein Gpo141_00009937 [Globisporangium polare]